MDQDRKDFIEAIKAVSPELAAHFTTQMERGSSFDQVHAELKAAVNLVSGWRIGRGV